MAPEGRSHLGEAMRDVYVVSEGEYEESQPVVAFANPSVALAVSKTMQEAGDIDEDVVGVAEPIPYWTGDSVPPHRTCYIAKLWLQGPISRHNHCASLLVGYGTEVHWPWSCYRDYPNIARVEWDNAAKDTQGIREHLETRPYGMSMEVFTIEGYDPMDVYELAQRYVRLARSRYAVANIVWTDAPPSRQVTNIPPDWPWPERNRPVLSTAEPFGIGDVSQEKLESTPDAPREADTAPPTPDTPTEPMDES